MLGSIFIFNKKNENIIIAALAFASGVMSTVSITDLMPESYNLLINIFPKFPAIIYMLIFVVSGILFSMFIDKYIPTDNSLYRVGVFAMLAIIIHNIPEGIATFMATNTNIMLGISLTIAIALHNIPEGISISIPIYYATNSKFKAIFYTFISAISEPFGALLTYLFLSNYINFNPAKDTKSYPRPKPKVTVLSKKELKKFLKAAQHTNWYLEILLGLFCGLRKGEILALKLKDFNNLTS